MTDDAAKRPLAPWAKFWLSSGVRHLIVHLEALTFLVELHALNERPALVFMDPPDNLGVSYDGYIDDMPLPEYETFLRRALTRASVLAPHVWLSVHRNHETFIHWWWRQVGLTSSWQLRKVIWYFRFGRYREDDLPNDYRPQFWFRRASAPYYPLAILITSERQKRNYKGCDPTGRVPGDVWPIPRICGTFKERRRWIPNQHPERLVERVIKLCTKPGDLVVDPFMGSGTTLRICRRLDRRCITSDISLSYCRRVAQENHPVPVFPAAYEESPDDSEEAQEEQERREGPENQA